MSDSKYLDAYLKFNEEHGQNQWPSKLRMMGVEKYDPMSSHVSSHLFAIYFPEMRQKDGHYHWPID